MGCTSSAPAREVVEGVVVPEAEVDRANEFAGRGARGEYHNLVADHHSPHEHTGMEDWPLAKLRERLAAAPAEAPLAAVVTTGAMNPLHAGHAQMLHQAAARLREDGFAVVGAWVSPSHDGYVQPKAWSLGAVGLSAAFRLKLADHATADDRLVAVGAWEAQQPGDWPDYPLVAKALRERLHALAVLEDGALSRLRDARVFYVCGTDHAQKCGLYGGELKRAAGVGTVVVPRAGDMPSEQGAARAVAGWGPYIAQPAAGDVASFSSTRVRSAIAAKDADAVRTMLSASAARFLLQPTAEEHECYSADYEKLGVSPPPPTSTAAGAGAQPRKALPVDKKEILDKIQARFHALICERNRKTKEELEGVSFVFPDIHGLCAEDGGEDPPRGDFAVPGMYGGFYGVTVNRDESGTWGLDCESWCRVAGGSGQRHRITADETTLVEEGFC